MKSVLVVYYSRNGHIETVAKKIAARLGADLERIHVVRSREGPASYGRAAMEALLHLHPVIERSRFRPQDYDLIVIGTPVWVWNMSSPVRSYLRRHWSHCARVALFCTMGDSGATKVHSNMAAMLRQKPVATLALTQSDIEDGHYTPELARFVRHIQTARAQKNRKSISAAQATT